MSAKPTPVLSFAFVREDVALEPLVRTLVTPGNGAVVLFLGVVRGRNEGRDVVRLEYEAYEPMARATMEAILRDTAERFSIREVRVLHRLGEVGVSESAVVVAVASAHRAAAFDAARSIMDRIKTDAPIWKREVSPDGSSWVTPHP